MFYLILAVTDETEPTQYSAQILSTGQLNVIEKALWDPRPHKTYCLTVPNNKFLTLPCRASFRFSKQPATNDLKNNLQTV